MSLPLARKKRAVIIGTGITASLVYNFLKDLNNDDSFEILFIECGNFVGEEKWEERVSDKIIDDSIISVNDPYEVNPDYDQPVVKIQNLYSNWKFEYNMKLGFGGSGTRWGGNVFRYFDSDFQSIDNSDLYPFTYSELGPYYDDIEKMYAVCGDVNQDNYPWPDSKYINPPFPRTHAELTISSILADTYNSFSKPLAVQRFGKNACRGSRTCVESCPNNALINPSKISMEFAAKDPAVRFMYNTTCTSLNVDPFSGDILSCNVYSNGKSDLIEGHMFFVCANTIETIRILLNSVRVNSALGIKFMPETSDLIGRYWGSHLNVTGWIECDQPLYLGRGKVMNSFLLNKARNLARDSGILNHLLEIHNFPVLSEGDGSFDSSLVIDNAVKHMFAGQWGLSLREMLTRLNYGSRLNFVSEMQLTSLKSITLSEVVDETGLPLAKNNYEPTKYELDTLEYLKNELIRFSSLNGVCSSGWNGWGLNGNHPIGGYRMSKRPSEGIVNSGSLSHDHSNLALYGGGVLCSTSCVNPTLTISAVTKLSLDHAKDTLQSILL